jgi:hypothetical protein
MIASTSAAQSGSLPGFVLGKNVWSTLFRVELAGESTHARGEIAGKNPVGRA